MDLTPKKPPIGTAGAGLTPAKKMRSPRGTTLTPEKKKLFRSVDVSPAELAEMLPQSASEGGLAPTLVNSGSHPHTHHQHNLSVSGSFASRSVSVDSVRLEHRNVAYQKRVPWCFFLDRDEENKQDLQLTPSDFILNNLYADWKHAVARKLESIDKTYSSNDEKVVFEEIFREDPQFDNAVDRLVTVSKNCLSQLVHSLLVWRASMAANPASKRLTHNEERTQIAVEWLFCSTVNALLRGTTSENGLEDSESVQLEKLAFDAFKPPKTAYPSGGAYARKIPDTYATILGILSEKRFGAIFAKFNDEYKIATASKEKSRLIPPILMGVRFLRLKMATKKGAEDAPKFLSGLLATLKTTKKGLKEIYIEVIGSLLSMPCAGEVSKEVNYGEWNRIMCEAYSHFTEKKKTRSIWIPLLAMLLSNSERAFFYQYLWSIFDQLIKLYKKEAALRPTVMEGLKVLISAYLLKYPEADSDQSKLHNITTQIFPPSAKRLTLGAQESLNPFVDILVLFAKKNLEYTITRIIFDLLSGEIIPEKMVVALRTVIQLADISTTKTILQVPSSPVVKGIEAHASNFSIYLSHILSALKEPAKGSPESIKLMQELLKLCITCVPSFIPVKLTTLELIQMLAKYTTHTDRGISERAMACLVTLMETQPTMRSLLLHGLAEYSVSIDDSKSNGEIHNSLLRQLLNLLQIWDRILSTEMNNSTMRQSLLTKRELIEDDLQPSRLEGIAMVFMCHPPKTRQLAVEILEGVRKVSHWLTLRRQISSSPSIEAFNENIGFLYQGRFDSMRVMDVIREVLQTVVQQVGAEYRFAAETLDKIVMDNQAIKWTAFLAEFAKYSAELCPTAVEIAWYLSSARIVNVEPEDSPTRGSGHSSAWDVDYAFPLWRNYTIFTCTACIVNPQSPPSDPFIKNMKHRTEPAELFQRLQPFLQTKNNLHRQAARMALERVHHTALIPFFSVIKEQSIGRKNNKKERLRIEISAIYSSVARNMRQKTLCESPHLRTVLINYINDNTAFFSKPENDNAKDLSQPVRENLCHIIASVAKDLHLAWQENGEELLDRPTRKRLFQFLLKWFRLEQPSFTSQTGSGSFSSDSSREEKKGNILPACIHALSALLLGPCFEDDEIKPSGMVLSWVEDLLTSRALHSLGRASLKNFLLGNSRNSDLLNVVLDRCYSPDHEKSKSYFLAFVEVYKDFQDFANCPLPVLLNLILFVSIDSRDRLRSNAILLLQIVSTSKQQDVDVWGSAYNPPTAISSHYDIYRKTQMTLSEKLANEYPHLAIEVFNQLVHRLDKAKEHASLQRRMLGFIIPWVKKMNLDRVPLPLLEPFLVNLLTVTFKYYDIHPELISQIWTTLACENDNIPIIIEFCLRVGSHKHNVDFVFLAKQITCFLGRTAAEVTIDCLVNELSLKKTSLRSRSRKESSERVGNLSGETTADYFSATMPDGDYVPESRGHLALVLLAETGLGCADELRVHISVLLQQIFLGLHFESTDLVFTHCRVLLLSLIQTLVIDRFGRLEKQTPAQAEVYEEALQLRTYLSSVEALDWLGEESHSSKDFGSLITRVIQVLSCGEKEEFLRLRENWASEALSWALCCPLVDLQCRSFEIYSALKPAVSGGTINDILQFMNKCFTHDAAFKPTVATLLTLQAIVETIDSSKLIMYNQLFWSTIALLYTGVEEHYHLALKLLSKLLDRLNFGDKSVQNVLTASVPKGWDPAFIGIQPLLLKGLFSARAECDTVELLIKISVLPCDMVFQSDGTRLLTNILALLPRLVARDELGTKAAANLVIACNNNNLPVLAKAFASYTTYETGEVLTTELCKAIAEAFLPRHVDLVFLILFELLERGLASHQIHILGAIRCLLQSLPSSTTLDMPVRVSKWFAIVSKFLGRVPGKDPLQILSIAASKFKLSTVTIGDSNNQVYSAVRVPEFLDARDAHHLAARALEKVLVSLETSTAGSENVVSTDFFDKYFSKDDLVERDESALSEETKKRSLTRSGRAKKKKNREKKVGAEPEIGEAFSNFDQSNGASLGIPRLQFGLGGKGFDDILGEVRGEHPSALEDSSSRSNSDRLLQDQVVAFRSSVAQVTSETGESVRVFEALKEAGKLLVTARNAYTSLSSDCLKLVTADSSSAKALKTPCLKADALLDSLMKPQLVSENPQDVFTKYSSKMDSDPGLRQKFNERKQKTFDVLQDRLNGYLSAKTNVERMKQRLAEGLPSEEKKAVEQMLVRSMFELYAQLLLLYDANMPVEVLVHPILHSDPKKAANFESKIRGSLSEEINNCKAVESLFINQRL